MEGDGIWDTDWSTSASLEHTYFDYGVYYPAVEVMDPEGATDTDSQSIHVTHEVSWKVSLGMKASGLPALSPDETRIFINTDARILYCLGRSGSMVWNYIVTGRLIAVGPSGNILWDYPVQTIGIPPTIGNDGILYVPCGDEEDNWMSALDPAGVELWRIEGGFGSPSINGYLMAVQSQTDGLAAVQWPRERGDNQNTGRIR